jgi:hypothetical protein
MQPTNQFLMLRVRVANMAGHERVTHQGFRTSFPKSIQRNVNPHQN